MTKSKSNLWHGLHVGSAQGAGAPRDYQTRPGAIGFQWKERSRAGASAAAREHSEIGASWIPGVEIFTRTIHSQRHRGFSASSFGAKRELARNNWFVAQSMGGGTDVRAHGQRVSHPSAERAKGVEPTEWFRRAVPQGADRLFGYGDTKVSNGTRCFSCRAWSK